MSCFVKNVCRVLCVSILISAAHAAQTDSTDAPKRRVQSTPATSSYADLEIICQEANQYIVYAGGPWRTHLATFELVRNQGVVTLNSFTTSVKNDHAILALRQAIEHWVDDNAHKTA